MEFSFSEKYPAISKVLNILKKYHLSEKVNQPDKLISVMEDNKTGIYSGLAEKVRIEALKRYPSEKIPIKLKRVKS
jgi:hypothetical protein